MELINKKIIRDIIGPAKNFSAEQQLFNAACIIAVFSILFETIVAYFCKNTIYLNLSYRVITIIGLGLLYYFSRIKMKYSYSVLLFFIIVIFVLSIKWLSTGGSKGIILYYYLGVLPLILLLTKNRFKVLLIILFGINITGLSLTELYFPTWVRPNINIEGSNANILISFFNASLLIGFSTIFAKRLYLKEKKTLNRILHDLNNNTLNKNALIKQLSKKERNLCYLIVEGRQNKEIAEELNINICTVKTHINNIYKKLGVTKRSELIYQLHSAIL